MEFNLTDKGSAALVNAFKNVATVPLMAMAQKRKADLEDLKLDFANRLSVARQALAQNRANEISQRTGFLQQAVDNYLDPHYSNVLLSAGRAKPIFGKVQAKNLPGYSFDKATGQYSSGDEIISGYTDNGLKKVFDGVGADGKAVPYSERAIAQAGLTGAKLPELYKTTSDGGVLTNVFDGVAKIGEKGVYNDNHKVKTATAADKNASAAQHYATSGKEKALAAKARQETAGLIANGGKGNPVSTQEVIKALSDKVEEEDAFGVKHTKYVRNPAREMAFFSAFNGRKKSRLDLQVFIGNGFKFPDAGASAPAAQVPEVPAAPSAPAPSIAQLSDTQRAQLADIQSRLRSGSINKSDALRMANQIAPGMFQ